MVSDIALIVTAIGVFGVVLGLRQSYRERLRQFEAKYVERYWKISDQLTLSAIKGSFSGEAGERDERAIRSYIMLCEDELEMRRYGYIADSTYEMWAEGIRAQLTQSCFKNIWERVESEIGPESASQYTYLRTLISADRIKAGDESDPLKMSRWERTFRGLKGIKGV